MARRRSVGETDSSEMMLDTVCNVFGGVILMAVLLVIQTQASVTRLPDEPQAAQSLAQRRLAIRIERLSGEIDQLTQRQQALQARYAESVSPSTDALMQRRLEFLQATADAKQRVDDRQRELDENAQRLPELARAIAEAQSAARQTRSLIEQLRETILQSRANPDQRTVRLPVSHQSRATSQLAYLVVGRRVYPMWDEAHCRRRQIGFVGIEISPVSGAGMAVSPTGSNPQFLATLTGQPPQTTYVTFFTAVGNESFKSVRTLRELAANRGYDFGYCLYNAADPLIVYPGKPDVE